MPSQSWRPTPSLCKPPQSASQQARAETLAFDRLVAIVTLPLALFLRVLGFGH